MRGKWTLWAATVAATVVAVGPAISAQDIRLMTRVRGLGTEMHDLIVEGDQRSPSFRAMIDEIQQSNAIVMVQFGLCAKGRVRSCVTHVEGDIKRRNIRILVDTRTTNDRLIATIAHELHHALEIIRTPEAIDAASVLALYRRIAKGPCAQGWSDRCETEAALATEATVLDDLNRTPRR